MMSTTFFTNSKNISKWSNFGQEVENKDEIIENLDYDKNVDISKLLR